MKVEPTKITKVITVENRGFTLTFDEDERLAIIALVRSGRDTLRLESFNTISFKQKYVQAANELLDALGVRP